MSAASHVCLLRGINVGGHKLVKMNRLRAGFEQMGLVEVKTYLQSGNVVFGLPARFKGDLATKIGEEILRDFGFSVPVLILSADEVKTTLRQNPFVTEKEIDPATLHVTFLSGLPSAVAVEALAAIPSKPDRFRQVGRTIYLHCPQGYGNSKLTNTTLERVLSVGATTRNWKTINELARMLHG